VVAIAIAARWRPYCCRSATAWAGGRGLAAGIIFVGSYVALAIGRIPA